MRILTSNIWGTYFGNPVDRREDQLYGIYTKYRPDVLGLQEYNDGWYASRLMSCLQKDYAVVGTELYGSWNYVPLFFLREKYAYDAMGFERYAETPDASKGVTWAHLTDKESGKDFAVCNTHFWWKSGPEHDELRVKNARQIVRLMKRLTEDYGCPVFAFGDMNCTVSSGVFKVYAENGVRHLRELADVHSDISSHHGDPVRGEDGFYHGKPTPNDWSCSIDHIVGLGAFTVQNYRIITEQDALDATDHSPVYADVTLL